MSLIIVFAICLLFSTIKMAKDIMEKSDPGIIILDIVMEVLLTAGLIAFILLTHFKR